MNRIVVYSMGNSSKASPTYSCYYCPCFIDPFPGTDLQMEWLSTIINAGIK